MSPPPPQPDERGVLVQHRVYRFSERWIIAEDTVPEAAWHDRALDLLHALLSHWVARAGRDAAVYRNLAVRVRREMPRNGIDPDISIVTPAPPGARDLSSLRLWEPGHQAPALVIEVVSPGHPYKDYADVPDQCAALGVRELVVFDPTLAGPRTNGGPWRLQVWRRTDTDAFERVAAGDGPFPSEFLGAHWTAVEEGRLLRIASDAQGCNLWPTAEEAALARVAELEAELARRGG